MYLIETRARCRDVHAAGTTLKIEDVLLRDIIVVDRVHNTEFRLYINPTNIVLIFETAKVESRPGQLADTKLG